MSSLTSLTKFLAVLALGAAILVPAPFAAAQAVNHTNVSHFELFPNPKFVSCLGAPGAEVPKAEVTIFRGKLNDTLLLQAQNIRPGLAFDLFTVQRTNLLADQAVDPTFTGSFGLAHYQSDLKANREGKINAVIQTVLLDDIFGFDPDVNLAPTNTFHVGFWFDNPTDATVDGCNFDVTKATPFNGEHHAGPLAMISVPDADTKLGPLCTNPNADHQPATCNP
jgi:hypothetical protein